jgi:hypothetical protein
MYYCSSCRKTKETNEFYRKNKTYKTCNHCSNRRAGLTNEREQKLFNVCFNLEDPTDYLKRLNKRELWYLYKTANGSIRYPSIYHYTSVTKGRLVDAIKPMFNRLKIEKLRLTEPLLDGARLVISDMGEEAEPILPQFFYIELEKQNNIYNLFLNKNIKKKLNSLNVTYSTKILEKYLPYDVVNIINDYLFCSKKQDFFNNILKLSLHCYSYGLISRKPVYKLLYKLQQDRQETLQFNEFLDINNISLDIYENMLVLH